MTDEEAEEEYQRFIAKKMNEHGMTQEQAVLAYNIWVKKQTERHERESDLLRRNERGLYVRLKQEKAMNTLTIISPSLIELQKRCWPRR